MNITALDLSGDSIWPPFLPTISGVLLCYDAGNRDSLQGFKQTLSRCIKTRLM
jgi:hypothetical protein